MKPTQHCLICENRKHDEMTGVICGLTNKKPDFQDKCASIILNEEFANKISEVNVKYKLIKRTKADTVGHVILFITLGTIAILIAYFLGKYALDAGFFSTVPIIIMTVGMFLFTMAFGPLNKYRQEVEVAKMSKDRIDQLTELYGLEYEIDVKIVNAPLDLLDIQMRLKIKKKGSSHYFIDDDTVRFSI